MRKGSGPLDNEKCKWQSTVGMRLVRQIKRVIFVGCVCVGGFSSAMRWRLERERVKSVGSSLDIPREIVAKKE